MTAQPLTHTPFEVFAGFNPTPQGRVLHAMDVENMAGGHLSYANMKSFNRAYQNQVRINSGDQVLIACAEQVATVVARTSPANSALLVAPNTRDGADKALINTIDVAATAEQFDRVVIASGDHIFAPLAAALAAAGCPVTIAHRHRNCAAKLRQAATNVQPLRYPLTRSR